MMFICLQVTLRRHLINPSLAILSAQAVMEFSGNFDFIDMNDLIAHMLANEDVIGQTAHVYLCGKKTIALNAHDVRSLLCAQCVFIWCFEERGKIRKSIR